MKVFSKGTHRGRQQRKDKEQTQALPDEKRHTPYRKCVQNVPEGVKRQPGQKNQVLEERDFFL